MKYDIIFLDADGTLFDFDSSSKDSLKMTFRFIEKYFYYSNKFSDIKYKAKNYRKIEINKDNNEIIIIKYNMKENEVIKIQFLDNILNRDKFFNYSFSYLYSIYEKNNKLAWEKLERKEIDIDILKKTRFKPLFKTINLDFAPIDANDIYLAYLSNSVKFLDDAEEFLEKLRATKELNSNYPLTVLLTNGLAEVQNKRIQSSKINKYFDLIVISQEAGVAKPDRKIFEFAIEQLIQKGVVSDKQIKKEKMIIIGDSLSSDIKGGKNFGIKTLLFNQNNIKYQNSGIIPDYICNNYSCIEKKLGL